MSKNNYYIFEKNISQKYLSSINNIKKDDEDERTLIINNKNFSSIKMKNFVNVKIIDNNFVNEEKITNSLDIIFNNENKNSSNKIYEINENVLFSFEDIEIYDIQTNIKLSNKIKSTCSECLCDQYFLEKLQSYKFIPEIYSFSTFETDENNKENNIENLEYVNVNTTIIKEQYFLSLDDFINLGIENKKLNENIIIVVINKIDYIINTLHKEKILIINSYIENFSIYDLNKDKNIDKYFNNDKFLYESIKINSFNNSTENIGNNYIGNKRTLMNANNFNDEYDNFFYFYNFIAEVKNKSMNTPNILNEHSILFDFSLFLWSLYRFILKNNNNFFDNMQEIKNVVNNIYLQHTKKFNYEIFLNNMKNQEYRNYL